jgi:ABC-2 type transport system ATP-binding protein
MIEADGLSKRFGSFQALHPLTLRVGKGEVFGCLGPTGAVKSTATKLLCTLLRPTEGTARIAGFDVVKESDEVRRRIGYLPEKVPVYKPLTAREDLRYFGRLHGLGGQALETRVEEVLDRVELTGVEHRRAGTFSKGMTQRLGIARAMLHDPEVLFLDEPASGLDPTGRRTIREIMKGLAAEGRTIFLCSHDLGEVRAVARKIGFIRKGALVTTREVGTAAEGRLLELELDEPDARVLDAVRAVPGVLVAEMADGKLRVRGEPTLDRRDVARAIRRGGGTLLFVEEKEADIESLYQEYIEQDEAAKRVPVEAAPAKKAEVDA